MKNRTDYLNFKKRSKNDDFRPFLVKNGKFDDQYIRENFEKYDFLQNDFFRSHSYLKFYADFNDENRF